MRKDAEYLSAEEYQEQLQTYEATIRKVVLEFGEMFGIEGVLIFGSWARGNPHNESDLDLLTISHSIPEHYQMSAFEKMIEKALIPLETNIWAHAVYTDPEDMMILAGDRMYSSGFRIVTNDPNIFSNIGNLLGRRAKG